MKIYFFSQKMDRFNKFTLKYFYKKLTYEI